MILRSPPREDKEVQHYELLGESCIPHLDGERTDLIFEEHKIVEHNESASSISNLSNAMGGLPYFIALEKRFCFGPVLANVQLASAADVRSARLRLPNHGKVRKYSRIYVRQGLEST